MTEITFALIRRCHGNIGADDLEEITTISLIEQRIELIDNLELFSQIECLNLSKNFITRLQNISLLLQLKHLDVSFNRIDSNSVIASIKEIPKSLESINLSGNPCCDDDECLLLLQDEFPNLAIIIGEEADSTGSDPVKDFIESTEETKVVYDGSPLNSEEVLKLIVERKCRLQKEEILFDLETIVSRLNIEKDAAIDNLAQRKRFLNECKLLDGKEVVTSPTRRGNEHVVASFQQQQKKYGDLLNECKENTKESHDFMEQLILKARSRRDQAFAGAKTDAL